MIRNWRADSGQGRWRMAVWGTVVIMTLLPLIMTQVSDQMNWGLADFALFGGLLVCAGGAYELAARTADGRAYRAAVSIALLAAFLLVWINLAVGIIGAEDHPANLLFGGVLAAVAAGVFVARFQPSGMARAMVATAVIQALVGVIALAIGHGYALVLTGLFVALWLGSAWLFRVAAQDYVAAGSAR